MSATIVFDDDCGFCTWWARWAARRGDFALVGFGEVDPAVRERLPADWRDCAHLLTDDEVYSCGRAVEAILARADPASRSVVRVARAVPGYDRAREPLYRWVANRRAVWGRVLGD